MLPGNSPEDEDVDLCFGSFLLVSTFNDNLLSLTSRLLFTFIVSLTTLPKAKSAESNDFSAHYIK